MTVRVDRLRHLITVLEAVKEREQPFYLYGWMDENHPDCGTTACACGWAAMDETFKAEGLGLVPSTYPFRGGTYNGKLWRSLKLAFGDSIEFNAAMNFFGLAADDAVKLFHPNGYTDPRDVCAVIRRVRKVIVEAGGDPDAPDLMGPAQIPTLA